MTKQIEALKLAREYVLTHSIDAGKVFIAIEEAIAEAEKQEPVAHIVDKYNGENSGSTPPEPMIIWVGPMKIGDKLYTSPPQRQPLVIDSDEKASAHMEKALWEFIDTASMFPLAKPDPRTWPHVMAFAPQRQPLTDEQMNALWFETNKQNGSVIWRFARAIEAAHGIKENT